MGTQEQDEAQRFLKSFVEEFVNPLGPEDPPPLAPLSRKITVQELTGESLELGLRLLSGRWVTRVCVCV